MMVLDQVEQVSDFKTGAWQNRSAADLYHTRTVAAPSLFQVIRNDLYLRYISRYAPSGARILDLGCGTGLMSLALHDLGYNLVACDASQGMLDYLTQEAGPRNIEMRLGSGFQIPARDAEFDMVISRMFIQHFPNWPLILKEKSRVTRPGGIIFFDFGSREHVESALAGIYPDFAYGNDINNPVSFYAMATRDEIACHAEECGLEVLAIVPHGFLLCNASFWHAVGSHGVEAFNAKLDALLTDPKARELLLLIEESFLPHLPPETSYGNFVILRRKSS